MKSALCLRFYPLLLASFATRAVLAGDIAVTRIFGPQDPGGRYKHPASITELQNGDLYLAFYGGSGEYEPDQRVWGSRLKKGEIRWSTPQVIADTPFRTDGNAVVWQAPDGLVWLFYLTRHGETWSTSRVKGKISRDGAHTWSDSFVLLWEEGTMVQGPPIVLRNGDYLLPVYHETGHDRQRVGADSTSFFLRFDVKTQTWSETNRIRSRLGNIQATVAQITDDYLVAYARRGGGYGPSTEGYLVRSESRDGGYTWSEGLDSQFPNPNAAAAFLRLQSGNLLLVYNDSMHRRTPLTAAISTDNDETYPHRRNLAQGDNSFAYPFAIQTRDGGIHVVFTSDRRSVINHAVFDESDILNWKP